MLKKAVYVLSITVIIGCLVGFVLLWQYDRSLITWEEFDKIELGMSYKKVCQIIGGEGELSSPENGSDNVLEELDPYPENGTPEEQSNWLTREFARTKQEVYNSTYGETKTYSWKSREGFTAIIEFNNKGVKSKERVLENP